MKIFFQLDKFNDLKKYMHDELLQLIRDKSPNNMRPNTKEVKAKEVKIKEESKYPIIKPTSASKTETQSKMNSCQIPNKSSILRAEKFKSNQKEPNSNIIFSMSVNTKGKTIEFYILKLFNKENLNFFFKKK